MKQVQPWTEESCWSEVMQETTWVPECLGGCNCYGVSRFESGNGMTGEDYCLRKLPSATRWCRDEIDKEIRNQRVLKNPRAYGT